MPLSPLERRQLRARAHGLKPVVQVGDAGVTDALVAEASAALDHHELIKVRLPAAHRDVRAQLAASLCAALGAEQVQSLGRIQVIFRKRPSDSGRARPGAKKKRVKKGTDRKTGPRAAGRRRAAGASGAPAARATAPASRRGGGRHQR